MTVLCFRWKRKARKTWKEEKERKNGYYIARLAYKEHIYTIRGQVCFLLPKMKPRA